MYVLFLEQRHMGKNWDKEGRESEVETERISKKGDVRQVRQVLGQYRVHYVKK